MQLSAEPLHALLSLPLSLGGTTADQAASLHHKLQATSYLPASGSIDAALGTPLVVSLSSGWRTGAS